MLGIPEWAIGIGFIILVGSIVRVVIGRFAPADQLRGRQGRQRDALNAVADLKAKLGSNEEMEARLADLDDVQRRLADVEERLDFAERMLSQQRDAQRLGSPQK